MMRAARRPAGEPGRLAGITAITFDFGNTLVPVGREALQGVVAITARDVALRLGPFDQDVFLAAWHEERERQFREEVPRFREVDLADRFVRVLARLRGMDPPPTDVPWDQAAAAARSDPGEIAWGVEMYSRAFVEAIPAPPAVGRLLAQLSGERALGILSNWPLAATIDRFVAAAGWDVYLRAVVVSQRVGWIKPHPEIFAAALGFLGEHEPSRVLHVGDDWVADVVGAKLAGWRAAYLHDRPSDSPLPSSARDGTVEPDVELAVLTELPRALGELREAGG
jgi:FMN phosphatase YigB (HAD superfamily)